MALETAMRMSEMLTLTVSQIDLGRRTIFLDRTKNGSKRQVPISSVLAKILADHLSTLEDVWVFPEWGPLGKKVATNRLGHLFLRHEATARLYERTRLSDLEIASITGHKDLRMLKRYANLRGLIWLRRCGDHPLLEGLITPTQRLCPLCHNSVSPF